MRRSLVVLLASFACWVTPAMAQGGNGLYSPFPEPASAEQAQEYLQGLGVRTSLPELREGRSIGLPPAAAAAPTRRSGAGGAPGLTLLLAVLVPLALAGASSLARG